MSTQRRVHERYDIRLSVTLLHGSASYTGVTRNVSLGGMLIEGEATAIPFGAEVKVRLSLPAQKLEAEIPSTVRWVQGGTIGIQFGSLRAKEQWALNQLLKGATPSP